MNTLEKIQSLNEGTVSVVDERCDYIFIEINTKGYIEYAVYSKSNGLLEKELLTNNLTYVYEYFKRLSTEVKQIAKSDIDEETYNLLKGRCSNVEREGTADEYLTFIAEVR